MKGLIALTIASLSLLAAGSATASYPWRNHTEPFPFLFGNHIDTHQQTRLQKDGSLSGYFYIHFTGIVTKDGYPVATHVDCSTTPCTVGWMLDGQPGKAEFLYEVDNDHPVFLVSRSDIPQPGAHAHFHWLGSMPAAGTVASGYLLQLKAVDTFCFIHHAADAAQSSRTCRENGGNAVIPGIDMATHLNIVTSFP
jgi:hypothetical protein